MQSIPVPFIETGGRKYLTAEQLVADPGLAAFVKHFADCFEHQQDIDIYVWKGGRNG